MNENSFLTSQLYQDAVEQINATMDLAAQQHLNIFGQTWFTKHFSMAAFPRLGQQFSAILESVYAAPAASTINTNSERPIRSLDGFGKVGMEMLTAAHTYKLEAEDIRAIAEMTRMYSGKKNAQQLLSYVVNTLMNVRRKVVDGINSNIDLKVLTLLSNKGVFEFTEENDPNSPFKGQQLMFGFDDSHAATATTAWTDANKATVNVLEDIMAICDKAEITPTKMLMSKNLLMYMLTTSKLKLYINGTDKASRPISKTDLDTLFAQYGLPEIELVQREIRVDQNGGKESNKINPWNKNTILFVPDNNFGTIERRMTDNELGMPSKDVNYANFNGIEVQSWTSGIAQGTNYTEFVSAELTYAPVVKSIKNMYSLNTKASE